MRKKLKDHEKINPYIIIIFPLQAKSKRRFVLGLREVTKHLKLKKIKCVIVSPNLEKIQSKGKYVRVIEHFTFTKMLSFCLFFCF